MTNAEESATKKNKDRKRHKRRHEPTENNGIVCRVPKDTFSTGASQERQYLVENATKLENASDGSLIMENRDVSFRKKDRRKRRHERRHNDSKNNNNLSVVPKDNLLSQTSIEAMVMAPQHPIQNSVDPLMRQTQVESATVEKRVCENASNRSPIMTSAEESLGKRKRKKRRQHRRHNAIEVNGNLSSAPKDAFSIEASIAALALPPNHLAQNLVDPIMRQSQVENAAKKNNVLEITIDGPSTMTSAEVSLRKKDKRKRMLMGRHNAIESNGDLSGVPKDAPLTETSKAVLVMPPPNSGQYSLDPVARQSLVENETEGSPTMTRAEVSLRKENKRRHGKRRLNTIGSSSNLSSISKDTDSIETSTAALTTPPQHQTQYFMDPVMRQSQEEHERKDNNVLEDSHGSPTNTNAELNSRTKIKKRKRKKTGHDDIDSNVNPSRVQKDNFSPETSTLTMEMPPQHPFQFSMDPVTRHSQEENEGKGKNMVNAEMISRKENGRRKRHMSRHTTIQSNVNLDSVLTEADIDDPNYSEEDFFSRSSHIWVDRTIISHSRKKLLVLDLNGLLVDFVPSVPKRIKPDTRISNKAVFKRPFCHDFLEFCFDRFHVGIWSSRVGKNVSAAVNFLVGNSKSKLLFCWNRNHCTKTELRSIEDKHKVIVLKELRKLWENPEPVLPWKKGVFNKSNTLLLDDSPYKALRNPMHTGVFPYPYKYSNTNDTSLGPGGDLRVYLEGLAMANNVQDYVASHPFGQPAITKMRFQS